MPEVSFVEGYVSGAIGRVTELHGDYYGREWGFPQAFEARVATELGEFLGRYDLLGDLLLLAVVDGRIEGSVAIDGRDASGEGAHLRWFIVSPLFRGRGIGSQLLRRALDFCRLRGCEHVHLWTFEGLAVARALYERAGFRLVEERIGARWGTMVNEQRFRLGPD